MLSPPVSPLSKYRSAVPSIDGHYAFVVPTICSALIFLQYVHHGQVLDIARQRYAHLQDLCLADESSKVAESQVDRLIGSDYYWNFTTNIEIRGNQESQLQYIRDSDGFLVDNQHLEGIKES